MRRRMAIRPVPCPPYHAAVAYSTVPCMMALPRSNNASCAKAAPPQAASTNTNRKLLLMDMLQMTIAPCAGRGKAKALPTQAAANSVRPLISTADSGKASKSRVRWIRLMDATSRAGRPTFITSCSIRPACGGLSQPSRRATKPAPNSEISSAICNCTDMSGPRNAKDGRL